MRVKYKFEDKEFTGTVIELVPGETLNKNKFLVCEDESNELREIYCLDCKLSEDVAT